MAPKGAPLVEAVLAAEAWRLALVDVLARLRVVGQLEAHGTRALGAKRALDAAVRAAGVVVRAALLVWRATQVRAQVRSR